MPRIIDDKVYPTADELKLVIGISKSTMWPNPDGAKRPIYHSNIAALHFDGEMLAEMVYAHRQIEESGRLR